MAQASAEWCANAEVDAAEGQKTRDFTLVD